MPENAAAPEPYPLPDAAWLRLFRRRLVRWFAGNARDLPWRRNQDAYAIWVSETMLQQTQVAMVKPYFERFMERFPTIETLAKADEQHVLRYWEGLGYYRRARQAHRAAQQLLAEHSGAFPRDFAAVSQLPGIGRYTAGAVLSMAFDMRLPILEANTIRLHCRLLAYRGNPASTAAVRLLWQMAEAVLPRRGSGRLNQALMELGSTVCTSRRPSCESCPVETLCLARRQGIENEVPMAKIRPRAEDRHEAAVLVAHRGRVLLWQYPEGQRWAGLWDFPRSVISSGDSAVAQRELAAVVRQRTGIELRLASHLARLKHGVTRYRITLDCYRGEYVRRDSGRAAYLNRWVTQGELEHYPLNATGRRLSHLVWQAE